MHVCSCEVLTLFYETLLREKNTGFRILLDFFQEKEFQTSYKFCQCLSLSLCEKY